MSVTATVATKPTPKRKFTALTPTNRWAIYDGRTREERLLTEVERELVEHVGGKPTATQAEMIGLAVQTRRSMCEIERRVRESGGVMGLRLMREHLAYGNLYARLLRDLGPPVEPERVSPLQDLIGGKP